EILGQRTLPRRRKLLASTHANRSRSPLILPLEAHRPSPRSRRRLIYWEQTMAALAPQRNWVDRYLVRATRAPAGRSGASKASVLDDYEHDGSELRTLLGREGRPDSLTCPFSAR